MNNKTLLKYHSWLGLIAGLYVFIMGISGAILVFESEIEEAQWQKYAEVENDQGLNLDKAFRNMQEEYPNWNIRLVHFSEDEALFFNLRRPTERLFVFVHPATGEIIKEINELTTFTRWLLKFHYSFQAGPIGRIFVFVMGIMFFLSILTGLFLYRKSIFNVLLFRERIVFRNKRAMHSSLHRVVGVWSIILNLLLVITGIFLAYNVTMAGFTEQNMPETPSVQTPIKNILSKIEKEHPDFTPKHIRLPADSGGDLRIFGSYDSDPAFLSEYYNSFSANYRTGEITDFNRIQDASLFSQWTSALIPLHSGNFGGILIKLIYCLTGLSGPLLSVTGFFIWQKAKKSRTKRRKKKKIRKKS